MIQFSESALVVYVCYGCGHVERKPCKTERIFKSFVKKQAVKGKCLKCNSELNLFRNEYREQYKTD